MGDKDTKKMGQKQTQDEDPKNKNEQNMSAENDMEDNDMNQKGELGGIAEYEYTEFEMDDDDDLASINPNATKGKTTTIDELIESDEDALVR